ncbi:RNA polymerase sigma factor SigJ [Aeoliella sp. SH292]|uniref:RNA polymerase sigma factor SigJ n=1 Tax=Aeoliella sp. SH292 TaxID=3454464 RepID=UPI003F9E1BAE
MRRGGYGWRVLGMMMENLNELRPRMMSVAYRMLGSVADAEDAVQDAYLRLHTADSVTSPEGFLIRTTTRRCIDQLRAAQRRRTYIGPWVPEPVDTTSGVDQGKLVDSLSQGFLLMLERLSPIERAAFLLRSVFDYEYSEIAEVLDKTEPAVRQIVSRAKSRLQQGIPRFETDTAKADRLAEQFMDACRAGDKALIESLVTDDVEVHSDGGGRVTAARVVIRGRNLTARFLAGVFHKKRRNCEMHAARVNGSLGVVFTLEGKVVQVVSFAIDGDIKAIYMTLNPEKLARWSATDIR